MSEKNTVLKVFVGSPTDVDGLHRDAIDVVQKLNGSGLLPGGITLQPESWLHNVYSKNARLTPQQAFNKGSTEPSNCQACVFIFWKRVGTELAPGSFEPNDAGSNPTGTLWEFYNAFRSADGCLLYTSDAADE